MARKKSSRFFRLFFIFLLIGIILVTSLVLILKISPRLGAQGADILRTVFGPRPVAFLESVVYKIQDSINQLEFKFGGKTPSAPWQVAGVVSTSPPINLVTQTPTLPKTSLSTRQVDQGTPSKSTQWLPASIHPLGNLQGEGTWEPYIQDGNGNTVAFRTFLQPDLQRPYVVVAVVAFDLSQTSLHYVVGTLEPTANSNSKPLGIIPPQDARPGVLLAAFNGGFKTINGHFGVMANNQVLLQPLPNMGTVAFYRDGNIRIGEWGTDITYTKDLVTFRQNCPLMVHNGRINPLVSDNSVNNWGETINGGVVDFRSGLGISQDGKVLYYFAGEGVSLPTLANAMQDAGAYQAMQLDINNYYVLFTTFQLINGKQSAVPLLPKGMNSNVNRFLGAYSKDYFYITSTNVQP
jgi:hypothetical protein